MSTIKISIIIFICVIIVFFIGRVSKTPIVNEVIVERTVVDTLVIENVVEKTVKHIEYVEKILPTIVEKVDTLIIRDSVKVYVPINKYLFEEPNKYRIEASGYEVSLDKIELFPKTVYNTTIKEIKKTPKFSFGIQVGYSMGVNGFGPTIGIGGQYNLYNIY